MTWTIAAARRPARVRRKMVLRCKTICAGGIHFRRAGWNRGPHGARSMGSQVIGTKFVLYRETHSKEKDKRIKLVK